MLSFLIPIVQLFEVVTAAVASVVFLVFAGITLGASIVGLTVATPLFVIFSPILVPATMATTIIGGAATAGVALVVTSFALIVWLLKHRIGVKPKNNPAPKGAPTKADDPTKTSTDKPTGDKSGGAPGNKSGGASGGKPGGASGNKPEGGMGNKPGGASGDKPEGGMGNKPGGASGGKPGGASGDKPEGGMGNKPGGASGDKRPNGREVIDIIPRGLELLASEVKSIKLDQPTHMLFMPGRVVWPGGPPEGAERPPGMFPGKPPGGKPPGSKPPGGKPRGAHGSKPPA